MPPSLDGESRPAILALLRRVSCEMVGESK